MNAYWEMKDLQRERASLLPANIMWEFEVSKLTLEDTPQWSQQQ